MMRQVLDVLMNIVKSDCWMPLKSESIDISEEDKVLVTINISKTS